MQFEDFTNAQLKKIIRQYNHHLIIKGYYKMSRDDLLKHVKKHMTIDNEKIMLKAYEPVYFDVPEKKQRTTRKRGVSKKTFDSKKLISDILRDDYVLNDMIKNVDRKYEQVMKNTAKKRSVNDDSNFINDLFEKHSAEFRGPFSSLIIDDDASSSRIFQIYFENILNGNYSIEKEYRGEKLIVVIGKYTIQIVGGAGLTRLEIKNTSNNKTIKVDMYFIDKRTEYRNIKNMEKRDFSHNYNIDLTNILEFYTNSKTGLSSQFRVEDIEKIKKLKEKADKLGIDDMFSTKMYGLVKKYIIDSIEKLTKVYEKNVAQYVQTPEYKKDIKQIKNTLKQPMKKQPTNKHIEEYKQLHEDFENYDDEQQKKKSYRNDLSIKIIPPKPGDKYFDPGFAKRTKIEQLETVLKTSIIQGKEPSKKFYESIADDFYKNFNNIINTSPYKAVREFVNKYGLTPNMLKLVYNAKDESDFFPTGKSIIDSIIKHMNWYFKLDDNMNFLEGTAGIGNVGYWFKQKYPDYNITLNELDKNNLQLMRLFLNNDDYNFENKDFFKLPLHNNYDIIFLNPPFGHKNHLYVKFLLYGLKLLNHSSSKNKMLILICPELLRRDIRGNKIDSNTQMSTILDILKSSGSGSIPNSSLLRWINELEKKNFDDKDLKNAFDSEGKLYDLLSYEYNFMYGEKIGKFNDFGGTKMTADVYYFQVMK
jgi:hypothetical protein